uniref:3'-5' exonuclease n=1 Tax=Fervidobacterium thailandense TaxID=1008305 RepID=A0A7C5VLA5_9BACT
MSIHKWDDSVYCVVDVETTGVDPSSGDRIVEIAIVPVYKGKIVKEWVYSSLVNPKVYIHAYAQKVHRISNNDIEGAPELDEIVSVVRKYSQGTILVFHNATFDLTFLDYAAKEVGQLPLEVDYIDTLDIAVAVYGRRRKLESLAKELRTSHRVTHRAYDDAHVTAEVFIKLYEKYGWGLVHEFLKRWVGREY